ncbi:MAG: HAD family hydrolase [Proteobacteria bacterium]|nr:HAD family hydrolase [Pseudomonadota bacterium]NOG59770.1 HAD family hydrolase [Pseudomonadota bacterium]
MKLAIFDLDNTLIAGDSDCLWGEFLGEQGYVDSEAYQAGHDKFYQEYVEGVMDINEFLEFQLKVLGDNDREILEDWRKNYIETKIKPIMLPEAIKLIEDHRQQGHELLIITATNRFITEPIAKEFNIDNLIACEPEIRDGQYTGKVTGTPSYAQGKVTRLNEWLKDYEQPFEETWFYSDSHNDIPLLKEVNHAIAVDADETLINEAKKQNWSVISLR